MTDAAFISVVVPVYNGGPHLARCLDALLASDYAAREIVVVDDGSTDASADAAASRGCEVLRLDARSGPAAARNRGVRRARGPVILFVDADVEVRRDTLARFASIFRERPAVAAAFGSYDDAPAARNFFSQYKNLFHHYVHQQSSSEAETFWAGCGAIRRAAFEAVGGFDERRYARPSVEDIELGYRLRRAGFEIVLDGSVQVKHLKRWTLTSMLRSDIFDRALPWSRLIVEGRGPMINDLNLRAADRLSAALAAIALASLALSPVWPALVAPALAALAAVLIINRRLYKFFFASGGARFAAGAFVMQLLYYVYGGLAFALCLCAHALRGRDGGGAARPDVHAPKTLADE